MRAPPSASGFVTMLIACISGAAAILTGVSKLSDKGDAAAETDFHRIAITVAIAAGIGVASMLMVYIYSARKR
jgi:hypothetical protein